MAGFHNGDADRVHREVRAELCLCTVYTKSILRGVGIVFVTTGIRHVMWGGKLETENPFINEGSIEVFSTSHSELLSASLNKPEIRINKSMNKEIGKADVRCSDQVKLT
jgi:hypothetical protein